MPRFLYSRTHKIVELPASYEGRKGYTRLDPPDPVPEGSVAEVLEWVGDDPARRQAALDAELVGKQRSTLIYALSE